MKVSRDSDQLAARDLPKLKVLSEHDSSIDSLEADGVWCPMAHCNRSVSSFQHLPPLLSIRHIQKISHPAVTSRGFIHLGSFTGELMAVCQYASSDHPALVAYDYQDGSLKWTSPLEDLPGSDELPGGDRWPAGVLLAKMAVNGKTAEHYIFAANPIEFVAYSTNGTRIWKRATTEITSAAPNGIGAPTTLSFNDAKELVTSTNEGWVAKFNPLNGSVIDTYKMDTNVVMKGRLYHGTFISFKSPVVIGNTMYMVVKFKADPSTPLPPLLSPAHLIRIELCQPGVPGHENRIKPLASPQYSRDEPPDRIVIGGTSRFVGGSPSGWVTPEGKVLIFANAAAFGRGELSPNIIAVDDNRGVLRERWRSVLDVVPGDFIGSAPALDVDSRTLLVTTMNNLFVFRNVDALRGWVPSPPPFFGASLMSFNVGIRRVSVGIGSPFSLTFNPDTNEIVSYTNFRVIPSFGHKAYGFLGAFALPARGHDIPRPLWQCPLALTSSGLPAPGPGTFGQPALFRYMKASKEATGMIVNTVSTGTYIIK